MVIGNTQKGTMERQKQKAAVRDAIEHAVKLWRYKNRLNPNRSLETYKSVITLVIY